GDRHAIVLLNLTPVPREQYRVGVPASGAYRTLLSSDAPAWGGSGYGARVRAETERVPSHGYAQSLDLTLPPLGGLILVPEGPGGRSPVATARGRRQRHASSHVPPSRALVSRRSAVSRIRSASSRSISTRPARSGGRPPTTRASRSWRRWASTPPAR